jgi:tRNA pseudouridine38-40 synthase
VLYNHPTPSALLAKRAGWVFRPIDVERMRAGARHLIGTHDFTSFRASGCQANTPVKDLHELKIEQYGDIIVFTVRASAFLHHMVRNIVGSLIYIGIGRQEPDWMREVLQARSRDVAAPTFMPDGLYFAKIEYDPKWKLPQEASMPLPWL